MDITPEIVRELLHYDPDTGVFTWRERDRRWFKSDGSRNSWNTRYIGKRAGCVWTLPRNGYQCRYIRILDRLHKEHRIAWLWMTDEPIPIQIDHENRDATDNRWVNLRASTSAENGRNQSMGSNNTSGITGVCWDATYGRWKASCTISGRHRHLGRFDDMNKAAKAVEDFRAANGYDLGHGTLKAHYHQ